MFALLEKAKRGDAEAIDALVDLASSVAVRAVRKFLRNERRLEHEDLVQDTLLDIARDLHHCRAVDSREFSSWVARVAHNTVAGARQRIMAKRRGEGVVPVSMSDFYHDMEAQQVRPPDQIAIARETWAAVQEIIDEHDPRCRDRVRRVVTMFAEGFSCAEIVAATESTALATHGVLKRFRRKLDEAGISPA